ncbi:MAG: WD40/YVTN/BNR-like repeat-containing protein [Steroidobacteraceae bacterium]
MRELRTPAVRYHARLIAFLLMILPLWTQSIAQTVAPQLFADMKWRMIGPFRGGRAVAVGGVPGAGNTFFFGAVDGGVWKTTDAGTVWKPVFDNQPVASIGALEVSPSNPSVIYVGTGESDIRSDLASGAGVYKSVDGGETWAYAGLGDTRQISKIALDPTNPDIVYVGALGHAYGPNPERGVYKTIDGGMTWKRTLDEGPNVGVADLAIAVAKPSVLVASLWEAHRPPWSTYAPIVGPGSGIFRSLDAGETWQQCVGHGLPEGTWGRTGVAVSADGQRVYALIEAKHSGLYVSNDGGQNWTLANADNRLTSRAWYFSRITVDPSDPDTIYIPNIALLGSADGGKTITVVRGAPGGDDYHELWVDPKNRDRLVLGTDQGTIISLDRGNTWSTWYNQPTAQLYHVTTDNRFPYTVYGAQQDSGGVAVLSRTDHGQITARDWFPASGSESGYFALDPRNPDILYASGSYGSVSRWDRRRSLTQDVSPWPVPVFGTDIPQRKYRDPWTPPLVFSPVDKSSLYLGTQYVLKTMDGGLHWQQISPDLTGGKIATSSAKAVAAGGGNPSTRNPIEDAPKPAPEMAIALGYGTLATVAPSYVDRNVLWTGSDTGIISLTRNGGKTWTNVTPPGIQPWSKISLIEPSHFDSGVAYAAIERHRMDDRAPHIYRTRNYGRSWDSITTGLEAPAFVLAVREDPRRKELLYAGTEFGIEVSFDEGDHWQPLQLNLPVTSVRDLTVHGDDLVIATHGRSFWILDDITPLRQAAQHAQSTSAFLYKPETAVRIDNDAFPGTPIPFEEPTADNPPSGAVLDYYLPGKVQALAIRIYDSGHKMVRQVRSAPEQPAKHASLPIAERWFPKPQHLETHAGMHRFVWNLAWGASAATDDNEPDDGEGGIPHAPRVVPGAYTAELEVNGERVSAVPLILVKDPRSPATQAQLVEQFEKSRMIFDDSLEARGALAEIATVKLQLEKIVAGAGAGAGNEDAIRKAKELSADLETIVEGNSGLDAANMKLTRALNVVESSERQAPSQALAVYELARAASHADLGRWTVLKSGPLATLNQALTTQGMPPIAITEIEREIDYFMTR